MMQYSPLLARASQHAHVKKLMQVGNSIHINQLSTSSALLWLSSSCPYNAVYMPCMLPLLLAMRGGPTTVQVKCHTYVQKLMQVCNNAHVDQLCHIVSLALTELLTINPGGRQYAPACVLHVRTRHHNLNSQDLDVTVRQ